MIKFDRGSQRGSRASVLAPQKARKPAAASLIPDTRFELRCQLRYARHACVGLIVCIMSLFAAINSRCLGEESDADARIVEALKVTTDAAKLYDFQLRGKQPGGLDFNLASVWHTEIWPWAKVQSGRETYTSFGPFEQGQPIR